MTERQGSAASVQVTLSGPDSGCCPSAYRWRRGCVGAGLRLVVRLAGGKVRAATGDVIAKVAEECGQAGFVPRLLDRFLESLVLGLEIPERLGVVASQADSGDLVVG